VIGRDPSPLGLLMMPYVDGASNWPGGSYDPETHTVFLYSQTAAGPITLFQDRARSDLDYITKGADYGLRSGVDGLPLIKPPWGRITAIDLDTGDIRWQVAHGETPDVVRNHPGLNGVSVPRTGRPGRLGTLTTKTLLIAGEAGFVTTPSGRRGAMLRAYDKGNGNNVGAVYMPAPATGAPMTYLLGGRQFVVVAVGGGDQAPGLVGAAFVDRWTGLTAGDLFDRIRVSMPLDKPGSLSPDRTAEVLAFILQQNQYAAGTTPLASDDAALRRIAWRPPG